MIGRNPNANAHWVTALQYKQAVEAGDARSLLAIVEKQAALRRDALALLDEQERVTYGELVRRARGYAAWARRQGLRRGDAVGLMMPNSAEYVAVWLGLSQIGCVVALLNTHQLGEGLAHSLRISRPRHVIVAPALLDRVAAALDEADGDGDGDGAPIGLWLQEGGLHCLRPGLAAPDTEPEAAAPPAPDTPALLIFTSGTTGLPKAAYVTHGRILEWSAWFAGMMAAEPEDRLFDCLPMYHSVGGVVAVGAMLYGGGSVVIRQHFSASRFWQDVADTGCTIFQYIGELCRYLLHAPEVPDAARHRLRLCCGNGLREEVWTEFQSRFAIPRILEYYAATEGNVSLYNCEGKPGAIGRIPAFLAHRFPVALIRIDDRSGEPLRDEAGRCIAAAADEPGEAIGRVDTDGRSAARRFDGYTDPGASARKLLRDVFAPGDCWFRTGDLMRRDRAGFYYFVDRLGSSFRWKGENVSATEVASVIMAFKGVADAVVYGVSVPGQEGRAGMAAVVASEDVSLTALKAHMAVHLPAFARPLFIRLCPAIPATPTFKLKQEALVRDGLAVEEAGDTLWFNEPGSERVLPCDVALLSAIASGSVRV